MLLVSIEKECKHICSVWKGIAHSCLLGLQSTTFGQGLWSAWRTMDELHVTACIASVCRMWCLQSRICTSQRWTLRLQKQLQTQGMIPMRAVRSPPSCRGHHCTNQ